MGTFFEEHPTVLNTVKVLLIVIAIVVFANIFGIYKKDSLTLEIKDDVFHMYYDDDIVVQFEKNEIISLELLDELTLGDEVDVIAQDDYEAGTWKNDTWGEYTLYIDPSIERYVVVTTDNDTFVFNYSSEDATDSVYNALLNW